MKFINSTTIALALFLTMANSPYSKANPDEGMYPLSGIKQSWAKESGVKDQ